MKNIKSQKLAAAFLIISAVVLNNQTAFGHSSETVFSDNRLFYSEKFWRTELYFGTDKPDGSDVSDAEWRKFLADEVTPRFPGGFTVLEGLGQFRDAGGKIIREESKVLILLYPKKERKAANQKIEEIRAAYKKAFQQESVLRLDFSKAVRVSF